MVHGGSVGVPPCVQRQQLEQIPVGFRRDAFPEDGFRPIPQIPQVVRVLHRAPAGDDESLKGALGGLLQIKAAGLRSLLGRNVGAPEKRAGELQVIGGVVRRKQGRPDVLAARHRSDLPSFRMKRHRLDARRYEDRAALGQGRRVDRTPRQPILLELFPRHEQDVGDVAGFGAPPAALRRIPVGRRVPRPDRQEVQIAVLGHLAAGGGTMQDELIGPQAVHQHGRGGPDASFLRTGEPPRAQNSPRKDGAHRRHCITCPVGAILLKHGPAR